MAAYELAGLCRVVSLGDLGGHPGSLMQLKESKVKQFYPD